MFFEFITGVVMTNADRVIQSQQALSSPIRVEDKPPNPSPRSQADSRSADLRRSPLGWGGTASTVFFLSARA